MPIEYCKDWRNSTLDKEFVSPEADLSLIHDILYDVWAPPGVIFWELLARNNTWVHPGMAPKSENKESIHHFLKKNALVW